MKEKNMHLPLISKLPNLSGSQSFGRLQPLTTLETTYEETVMRQNISLNKQIKLVRQKLIE